MTTLWVLSAFALVLWYNTKDPDVAIMFGNASDAAASVPTLTKAWGHPETELAWSYLVGVFNAVTSYLAIGAGRVSAYAFRDLLDSIINVSLFPSVHNRKLVLLVGIDKRV